MAKVNAAFAEMDPPHKPSEEMLEALSRIPEVMADMVEGTALPAYYVCPLDTGVGKTTALRYTIEAMLASDDPLYRDAGVVVAVQRLENIEALITDMALPDDQYAVLVSASNNEDHERLRAAGRGWQNVSRAPVLFTTHAMLTSRIVAQKEATWGTTRDFYYAGKPRRVRVYDEALIPGLPITLTGEHFVEAASVMYDLDIGASDALLDFEKYLRRKQLDDRVIIPDFLNGQSVASVADRLSSKKRMMAFDRLSPITALQGQKAVVRRMAPTSNKVVLTFLEGWPEDIKPMLVLDASAPLRDVYRQHSEAKPGSIRMLEGMGVKRFDNVTVHVHPGASGKSALTAKNGQARYAEIKNILDAYDGRHKALVLHHIKGADRQMVDFSKLKSDIDWGDETIFVKTCNWGRHAASNEFRDCDIVICASNLYKPDFYNEALHRTSARIAAEDDCDSDAFKSLCEGEAMSDLQQGIGRSKIRTTQGTQAPNVEIHVWASDRSKVKIDYRRIFPGCRILYAEKGATFGQHDAPPKAQTQHSNEFVRGVMDVVGTRNEVEAKIVYKAMKMDSTNFRRAWQRHSEALAQAGVHLRRGQGRYNPAKIVRAA
jgi:hypothetical protein